MSQDSSRLPVNDDTLDYLENELENCNDPNNNNQSEKMALQQKLQTTIKGLMSDVDNMIEFIETLEIDDIEFDSDPNEDITDVVSNIEREIEVMKEEESYELKIKQYERIREKIQRCRKQCTGLTNPAKSNMNVTYHKS